MSPATPATNSRRQKLRGRGAQRVASAVVGLMILVTAACGSSAQVEVGSTNGVTKETVSPITGTADLSIPLTQVGAVTGDPEPTAVVPPEPTEAPTAVPTAVPTVTSLPEPTAAPEPQTTEVFCSASRLAYESYVVLDLLPQDSDTRAIAGAMDELIADISKALPLAPNAEMAEPVRIALDNITFVNDTLIAYNYDDEGIEAAEPQTVAAFETFTDVMRALEGFLAGPCGYDESTARGIAELRAERLLAMYPPQLTNDVTYVDDNWGDIELAVPATWTEVESYDDGTTRGVVVTPYLSAYHDTWNADGVSITAMDISGLATVPTPSQMVEGSPAWSDCIADSSGSYDDGLYLGEIHYFVNCGAGTAEAVVVAATNPENTLLVVVELQMVNLDESVMRLILDSFRA